LKGDHVRATRRLSLDEVNNGASTPGLDAIGGFLAEPVHA
jgi:hypothetical protein